MSKSEDETAISAVTNTDQSYFWAQAEADRIERAEFDRVQAEQADARQRKVQSELSSAKQTYTWSD